MYLEWTALSVFAIGWLIGSWTGLDAERSSGIEAELDGQLATWTSLDDVRTWAGVDYINHTRGMCDT